MVITTDAVADAGTLDAALRAATDATFDRIDSDGCTRALSASAKAPTCTTSRPSTATEAVLAAGGVTPVLPFEQGACPRRIIAVCGLGHGPGILIGRQAWGPILLPAFRWA